MITIKSQAVITYMPDRNMPDPILQIVKFCAERTDTKRVDVWHDETDNTYGISYTEDGLTMTGYFAVSHDGEGCSLVGDWIC